MRTLKNVGLHNEKGRAATRDSPQPASGGRGRRQNRNGSAYDSRPVGLTRVGTLEKAGGARCNPDVKQTRSSLLFFTTNLRLHDTGVFQHIDIFKHLRKPEEGMIGSNHKAALPFNLFIDVLNMEKIQSIQTQSKEHVHHFKYSTKDILFQKCCEPSQTIQLQINNHSHIKN